MYIYIFTVMVLVAPLLSFSERQKNLYTSLNLVRFTNLYEQSLCITLENPLSASIYPNEVTVVGLANAATGSPIVIGVGVRLICSYFCHPK